MAVEEDVFTTSSYSITSLTGTAVTIKLSGSWIAKQINGNLGPGVFIVNKASGGVINATVSYASMSGTTTATITGEGLSPETEYAIPECAGFIFYDNSRLDIPTRIEFTTASVTPTEDESYLNERGLAHFWENIDTLKQDKLTAGTNIAISANNTISAETGWKYLGQVKLASAGASLTFNLPAQYDNYKIIAAGEMASGSNATCQLQLLRSGSAIPSAWCVLDINGSNIVAGTRTAADDQFSMATCNQYDTINMEMTSFKTVSTQWRKYQGYQARMGSAYVTRQYNGRFNSSTEPNQVRIWTSATFGAGTVIKVWASNNT